MFTCVFETSFINPESDTRHAEEMKGVREEIAFSAPILLTFTLSKWRGAEASTRSCSAQQPEPKQYMGP